MTVVSLAQSARRLGIDAKTLRRWLAEAQLPLQSHPSDARLKGLGEEQLRQLAEQHHRALAGLPEPAPAPTPPAAALPPALLEVPQRLAGLQAQIATLQQQVSALSRLLESQAPPAGPTAALPLARAAKPAPPPARKPTHVLARVAYAAEGHYIVICPKQGVLPFEPDSPPWFAWLSKQSAFRFVGKQGHFTAHYDAARGSRIAWRAHRKIRNHTCNLRLGRTNELSVAVLEQAAARFQAQLT